MTISAKLKDGQNCCDERNIYFEEQLDDLKKQIDQVRDECANQSEANYMRMPMAAVQAPPSTLAHECNNDQLIEQMDALNKKVDFLLEQNYLKDELLIQLDEKIDKNDGNQFEPIQAVLASGRRLKSSPVPADDDRLKDLIKRQDD